MTITEPQAVRTYMLIGALLAHVRPHEQTPKVTKIRTQFRKWMNKLVKHIGKEQYLDHAREADRIWEEAKKECGGEEYVIAISSTLRELYYPLEGTKYARWVFSPKRYFEACQSLEMSAETPLVSAELDGYELGGIFLRLLGIKQKDRLAEIRARMKLKQQEKELGL